MSRGPQFYVNIKGASKLRRKLDRLAKRAPLTLRAALAAEAQATIERSNQFINHFEGKLARTAYWKLVDIGGDPEVELGYDSPHAWAIHEGFPPGWGKPPPEALKPWAAVKLGDERAAFALSKKLFLYGSNPPPTKYLQRAVQERSRSLGKRLIRALEHAGWN